MPNIFVCSFCRNSVGATYDMFGSSYCGDIFRTSGGFLKGGFSYPFPDGFAFEAKLLAVLEDIVIAWDKGWHNLLIETDSSFIVFINWNKSILIPCRLIVDGDNVFLVFITCFF